MDLDLGLDQFRLNIHPISLLKTFHKEDFCNEVFTQVRTILDTRAYLLQPLPLSTLTY